MTKMTEKLHYCLGSSWDYNYGITDELFPVIQEAANTISKNYHAHALYIWYFIVTNVLRGVD